VATAAQLFDQIAGSDSTTSQTAAAPAPSPAPAQPQQNSAADAFDKIASSDFTPAVQPGIHHGIPSLKGPSSTLSPGQELGLNAATAVQAAGVAGAATLPRLAAVVTPIAERVLAHPDLVSTLKKVITGAIIDHLGTKGLDVLSGREGK
jgi:hypothetical protein